MATLPKTPAMQPARTLLTLVPPAPRVVRDITASNVSAGLTAVLFYTFGAVPVFLGVTATMPLTAAEVSSWYFIAFLTSGVATIALSLRYRQPLAIGFTLPGLVLLSAASAHYSLAQMMGACLLAGLAILGLAAFGLVERLMRALPLPLVLGMFVGSTLHYLTGVFTQFDASPGVVGAALAGYLTALTLRRTWLPPVAGAVVVGIAAAAMSGGLRFDQLRWGTPEVHVIAPAFDFAAVLTLTLPLVILVVASGNVQGLGVLAGQGYVPPVRATTYVVGLASIVNSIFGSQSATVQNVGTGILAGEEAGERDRRYVATVVAGLGCVVLACAATFAGGLVGVLPAGLVAAFAGLAVLRTLLDTTQKALTTDLPTGAFVALAIAASPLSMFGIGPALWALVGGYAVSFVVERTALRASARCLPCEAAQASR